MKKYGSKKNKKLFLKIVSLPPPFPFSDFFLLGSKVLWTIFIDNGVQDGLLLK